MSLVKWQAHDLFTVTNVHSATAVADATPVLSSAIDLRTLDAGARHVLIMNAFETNVANTGGTWSVTESATSAGVYTAATTSGSLAATGETVGNVVRKVSLYPNRAMPFIKVTFTGADANTEVTISALLLSFTAV
jgi:hypothetical protein